MDPTILELNQEIQTYKELLYELANLPGALELIREFLFEDLEVVMNINSHVLRTTDIKTFFENLLKDKKIKNKEV